MKIELKKLKISDHLSQETTAFTADIYIDGIQAGYTKNDGQGGPTGYWSFEGKKSLIEKAEKYCESLPPLKYETFTIPMNLEVFIDELVNDELKKKDLKKLEKKMTNHLIWGLPGGDSYKLVKFHKSLSEIPVTQLQEFVNKYKKGFKKGEVFINTNLSILGVKI